MAERGMLLCGYPSEKELAHREVLREMRGDCPPHHQPPDARGDGGPGRTYECAKTPGHPGPCEATSRDQRGTVYWYPPKKI